MHLKIESNGTHVKKNGKTNTLTVIHRNQQTYANSITNFCSASNAPCKTNFCKRNGKRSGADKKLWCMKLLNVHMLKCHCRLEHGCNTKHIIAFNMFEFSSSPNCCYHISMRLPSPFASVADKSILHMMRSDRCTGFTAKEITKTLCKIRKFPCWYKLNVAPCLCKDTTIYKDGWTGIECQKILIFFENQRNNIKTVENRGIFILCGFAQLACFWLCSEVHSKFSTALFIFIFGMCSFS